MLLATEWENEPDPVPVPKKFPAPRRTEKGRRTSFNDQTAVLNVQPGRDERNIGQIQNLGAMGEGHGP
jgi:hypothetical protein